MLMSCAAYSQPFGVHMWQPFLTLARAPRRRLMSLMTGSVHQHSVAAGLTQPGARDRGIHDILLKCTLQDGVKGSAAAEAAADEAASPWEGHRGWLRLCRDPAAAGRAAGILLRGGLDGCLAGQKRDQGSG